MAEIGSGASPLRVGILNDYPSGDGGRANETALRLGFDAVRGPGLLERDVELVPVNATGLPMGSEHAVVAGLRELDAAGCLVVVGPAISDNGLVITPLCGEIGLASINYTGGEHTRGAWGFHYQVGSLEEEPAVLAQRLVDRGLSRPAVVHDRSPVGRRYAEFFDDAAAASSLEITGRISITPLAEDVEAPLRRLRAAEPDSLVYLGLGITSRSVALGLDALGWDVPVVANSALMFGYARPDWRDGWRGWEYLDAVADDNASRQELAKIDLPTASSPVGCALYDIGRMIGEALGRAEHLTRAGVREALLRVKRRAATCGRAGTLMGFGVYDHAALTGEYLVLREWRDGETIQVD